MIAELQYGYNGKLNDISGKVDKCVEVLNRISPCKLIISQDTDKRLGQTRRLNDLVGSETANDIMFAQLPFAHPFVIMFSSGTTGTPKGIVHSQGGLTLNGIKTHLLHNNFGSRDIHFHYSGIGWTLWNISLGAMFCQTALILYDGSPFYPSPDVFLRSIFNAGVTGYGGSPRFFSELQKRDVRLPREATRKMHTLLSTGALLTPGTADWLAEAFGPVCQINFTGGTELCGNFMGGTRSRPSYAGEIAVKELGMDVDAFGPDGEPVPAGQPGELVCKKPFPNMPVSLWNDLKFERYRRSYFSGFHGVWTHGDLIRVNPETGGTYVLGRSDGVLNPSGVRFGTSELYNILAEPNLSGKVLDGLAIGQQRDTSKYSDPTERVVLFLKTAENQSSGTLYPRKELLEDVKKAITRDLSRRHIPSFFFEMDEIPHNANGKKMEIQVKQVCNGGREALDKMTLTDLERGLLEKFVQFHDVEKVAEGESKRESKL
jgi:acetoacetyl-CoA synthetase